MARGRGSGRGRGRGRGGRNSAVTAVLTLAAALSATSTIPRGRGRGRGGRGRGRGAATDVAAPANSQEAAGAAAASATNAYMPLESNSIDGGVVVVEVPRHRMITRALLKGTSPALAEYTVSFPVVATSSSPGRRRSSAGTSSSTYAATVVDVKSTERLSISSSTLTGTAAVDPSSPTSGTRVIVGGVLRCVCNAFLVTSQEYLLECTKCRNWCHPACVGLDHAEVRLLQRQRSFVCPYCTGCAVTGDGGGWSSASKAAAPGSPLASRNGTASFVEVDTLSSPIFTADRALGAASPNTAFFNPGRQPPAPRQAPLKLQEVPDRPPMGSLLRTLTGLLVTAERVAEEVGYDVIHLSQTSITESEAEECLDCCTEAVLDATFSASYPAYCLKEVRAHHHPYLQGTLLRSRADGKIRSMVLSNGMDVYGNLKPTITQLKSGLRRGYIASAQFTDHMTQCTSISDVSDFVHITLSATHATHQRKGLARLLMVMDLLKWALRGRTRAFLNMAIEKNLVDGGTRIEYASPPASRRLYESFGFMDVYARYDRESMKERWTAKEADMGRVMANLNFVPHVIEISSDLESRYLKQQKANMKSDRSTATSTSATSTSSEAGTSSVSTSTGHSLRLLRRSPSPAKDASAQPPRQRRRVTASSQST